MDTWGGSWGSSWGLSWYRSSSPTAEGGSYIIWRRRRRQLTK